MATANLPQGADIIGAVVPRIDGPLKTTGTARYSVDHDFPNLAARGGGAEHHRQRAHSFA